MNTNSTWLSITGHVLLLVACAYALFTFLMYVFQSWLVFNPRVPTRKITATPDEIGLAYESVKIITDDGIELDGWFLTANDARGTLIFCHGNAGNISHRLDSLRIFDRLRLSVLIFDYRGYGRSGGKVSEEGTYRDAEAVWRYLIERNVPAESIVIFGRSLGAAIAAHLAQRHTPAALILESAFTSVPDYAASAYPYLPARRLARFRFSTKEYLESVKSPVLIVHSPDDDLIPFRNGRELFAAANGPKQFLEISGDHNEGFLDSGATYIDGLNSFLSAYLPRPD